MLNKKWIALALSLVPAYVLAGEKVTYLVRKGDTLSKVAVQYFGKPLYGEQGSLRHLSTLNPQIKNVHLIYPGDNLYLAARPSLAPKRVPAAEETPVPVVPTPVEFEPLDHLDFISGYEYFSLDARDRATNGEANLLSRMSPTFGFRWDLDWSEEWASRVQFNYRKEQIETIADTSKTFQGASGKNLGLELSFARSWQNGSRSRFGLRREEKDFVRSPDTRTVAIDRLSVSSVLAAHELVLWEKKAISFGVNGTGSILLPAQGASYKVQTGWGGDAGFFFEHRREVFSLRAQAHLGFEKQNTTIAEQSGKNTGLSLTFSWRLP